MKEITPLLNKLAAQLNTTVEFLWEVLVRQAQFEFIIFIIGILVILLLDIAIRYVVLHAMTKTEQSEDDKRIASMAIFLLGTIALFFYIFLNGRSAIIALLNPEYWALQQILEVLKR